MKKLLAIVLIAAGMSACNNGAGNSSTSDSTTISTDSSSMTPSPAAADGSKLRTDTSGPGRDSGLKK